MTKTVGNGVECVGCGWSGVFRISRIVEGMGGPGESGFIDRVVQSQLVS
jgi:hypothetical protein